MEVPRTTEHEEGEGGESGEEAVVLISARFDKPARKEGDEEEEELVIVIPSGIPCIEEEVVTDDPI